MTRFALLVFLIACDQGRRANDPPPAPPRTGLVLDPEGLPSAAEVIPVPGGTLVDADAAAEPAPIPPAPRLGSIPGNGEPARPTEGTVRGTAPAGGSKGAAPDPHPLSDLMRERAKDPTSHLQAEEGTLTVSRVDVART